MEKTLEKKIGVLDMDIRMDSTKTKELVEAIGASTDGILVKDPNNLPQYLQKRLVKLWFSSEKGSLTKKINSKELGFDIENSSEFKGIVSLFSEDTMNDLNTIPGRVKMNLTRMSLTTEHGANVLTFDDYLKFKKYYQDNYEEFKTKRDNLIVALESHKEAYQLRLDNIFEGLPHKEKMDKADWIESKLKWFPDESKIMDSFKMGLELEPYPVFVPFEIDEEYKEVYKDLEDGSTSSAVSTFYGMIGTVLNGAFERIVSLAEKCKSVDILPSKSKGGLNSTLKGMINDNDILKNDMISDVIAVMTRVFVNGYSTRTSEPEAISKMEIKEVSENLLGRIYGYSKHIGVEKSINVSGYSIEDLLETHMYAPDLKDLL